MIVDCFIFYNELELLEYRLNIMNDLVDFFILVEATNTFIGEKKELFYENNKDKFKKFHNKIIHIIVDDMPIKEKLNVNRSVWNNEIFQRNCIKRGLEKLQLKDNSIILLSDVDEIIDPIKLTEFIPKIDTIYSVWMDLYWYNLNRIHKGTIWGKFKICRYCDIKDQTIENIRNKGCPVISKKSSGWHLSYFGDVEFIHNKLSNFAHQESAVQDINNKEEILKRMNNGDDLYVRNRGWKFTYISKDENNYLPPMYEKYLSKFINM